jgi:tungstate transport system substrate-binding protein
MKNFAIWIAMLFVTVVATSCGAVAAPNPAPPSPIAASTAPGAQPTPTIAQTSAVAGGGAMLTLATTTSTQDSGLLDVLIPGFEKQYNVKVKVVAVGTGQALKLGADGNADVVLVHARSQEDTFVKNGDGIDRRDVMYNDFIVVGPAGDPAKISGLKNAADAFTQIAQAQASFASRGDNSGTNTKELDIWKAAGISPPKSGWYLSVGQGMGETLTFANEKAAYTITDRATWLAQKARLASLAVFVGGSRIEENADQTNLFNPYGVIPVSPAKHPAVNHALAETFAQWITSLETQKLIQQYGIDKYGQSLFRPNSSEWRKANPGS